MKRIMLLAAIALLASTPLFGQKLVIGDKAPDLKITSWIDKTPGLDGKGVMVEFFHSSNKNCVSRLSELNKVAAATSAKMSVVVITREQTSDVYAILRANNPAYYPAYDEGGKMFSAFSASYVPYAVIYNRRGRVVWLGNPTNLKTEEINNLL